MDNTKNFTENYNKYSQVAQKKAITVLKNFQQITVRD